MAFETVDTSGSWTNIEKRFAKTTPRESEFPNSLRPLLIDSMAGVCHEDFVLTGDDPSDTTVNVLTQHPPGVRAAHHLEVKLQLFTKFRQEVRSTFITPCLFASVLLCYFQFCNAPQPPHE